MKQDLIFKKMDVDFIEVYATGYWLPAMLIGSI